MKLAGGSQSCLGKGRQQGGQRLPELCFLKENREAFQTRSRELLESAVNAVSGAALEAFLLRGIIRLWQKYLLARYLLALFALYSSVAERKDEKP